MIIVRISTYAYLMTRTHTLCRLILSKAQMTSILFNPFPVRDKVANIPYFTVGQIGPNPAIPWMSGDWIRGRFFFLKRSKYVLSFDFPEITVRNPREDLLLSGQSMV
jgi:hypothetical protein